MARRIFRSVGIFRKVGFEVEPYPVDWRTGRRGDLLKFSDHFAERLSLVDTAARGCGRPMNQALKTAYRSGSAAPRLDDGDSPGPDFAGPKIAALAKLCSHDDGIAVNDAHGRSSRASSR
jgi:hypothetical protein